MRTCGIEISSNELFLCLLSKDADVFDIRDIRQTRFSLPHNGGDTQAMRKFYFDFKKLVEDYKIDSIAIKERPAKGKFAGAAAGFKLEAALQLIPDIDVRLFSATEIKEQLKRNPIPIDFEETGLKKYQQHAFEHAYVYIMRKVYKVDEKAEQDNDD
ncbi:DUF3010 family protein [Pseudoalteromonas fenneropenaei]|uniref:DUF3010 family protein n=1 Tax=Pseudoalteromonas fenneropenaei TaxID=1737459 RepID=A0ABV7CFF2_9GAMM